MFAIPNKFLYFLNSLKELLRAKLIECGWKDQLKAHCKGNGGQITNILCNQLRFWPNESPRWKLYCLTVNLNETWARRKYPLHLVLLAGKHLAVLAKYLETSSLIWNLLSFWESIGIYSLNNHDDTALCFERDHLPQEMKAKIKQNWANTVVHKLET